MEVLEAPRSSLITILRKNLQRFRFLRHPQLSAAKVLLPAANVACEAAGLSSSAEGPIFFQVGSIHCDGSSHSACRGRSHSQEKAQERDGF